MTRFAVRRLLLIVPTLLGMSVLIFAMVRLLPGDVGDAMFTGEAVATAGVGTHRVAFPDHIAFGAYSVNVSRHGAVGLPVNRADAEWLESVCGLVARGSVALYERLLELEE